MNTQFLLLVFRLILLVILILIVIEIGGRKRVRLVGVWSLESAKRLWLEVIVQLAMLFRHPFNAQMQWGSTPLCMDWRHR